MGTSKSYQRAYLIGAAIVWAGTFIAAAVILKDTPYFGQLLPILVGGMVWFVVIVPGALFPLRGLRSIRTGQGRRKAQ